MSELPQIDSLKAEQRTNAKLIAKAGEDAKAAATRESQLELLAEALRDERDAARAEISELRQQLAELQQAQEVPDITSLPDAKKQ
jgi:hypothetical protein